MSLRVENKGYIVGIDAAEGESCSKGTNLTPNDFKDILNGVFMSTKEYDRMFVMTGFGGFWTWKLEVAFFKYGRQKLPRKMKKHLFGTKKLRRQYLPEYYGNKQ